MFSVAISKKNVWFAFWIIRAEPETKKTIVLIGLFLQFTVLVILFTLILMLKMYFVIYLTFIWNICMITIPIFPGESFNA